MLLGTYQIVIDNIKNKYGLTNIQIALKAGISKATLDKITSGKTKHLQEKTLEKLKKAFKDDFDSMPEPLNKVYVDTTTKKLIDAINDKPELKKICTITSTLKPSDLKAVAHILEKMSNVQKLTK